MVTTTLTALAVVACSSGPATLVGATLDDGQVMVGEVTTRALTLQGSLGEVEIPLADVGMVLPVEGRTMADSHHHATVWLRDGSELRGRWAAPELEMAVEAGGRRVAVDLPTERLQALQLRGSEAWPAPDRFRVRTIWGDDFLVDPDRTTLTLDSDLGRFDLTLAECEHLGPIGEAAGPWKVRLATGTVLVGTPSPSIHLVPSMGPDALEVPVVGIVSVARGGWAEADALEPAEPPPERSVRKPTRGKRRSTDEAPQPAAAPALSSSAGWFENERFSRSKR